MRVARRPSISPTPALKPCRCLIDSFLLQVAYTKTTQTDVDASGFREFHTASNEWFEDSPLAGQSQAGTPGEGPAEVFDPTLSPRHQLAGILPHITLVRPTEVQ